MPQYHIPDPTRSKGRKPFILASNWHAYRGGQVRKYYGYAVAIMPSGQNWSVTVQHETHPIAYERYGPFPSVLIAKLKAWAEIQGMLNAWRRSDLYELA
jgi:hypothetical protein